MDIEEKQEEHIDYFVKEASSLNGPSLANVVVEATSHPSLFAFSEILAVPSVLQADNDFHGHEENFSEHGVMDYEQDHKRPKRRRLPIG